MKTKFLIALNKIFSELTNETLEVTPSAMEEGRAQKKVWSEGNFEAAAAIMCFGLTSAMKTDRAKAATLSRAVGALRPSQLIYLCGFLIHDVC